MQHLKSRSEKKKRDLYQQVYLQTKTLFIINELNSKT